MTLAMAEERIREELEEGELTTARLEKRLEGKISPGEVDKALRKLRAKGRVRRIPVQIKGKGGKRIPARKWVWVGPNR